jgi:hypothetical protein
MVEVLHSNWRDQCPARSISLNESESRGHNYFVCDGHDERLSRAQHAVAHRYCNRGLALGRCNGR